MMAFFKQFTYYDWVHFLSLVNIGIMLFVGVFVVESDALAQWILIPFAIVTLYLMAYPPKWLRRK